MTFLLLAGAFTGMTMKLEVFPETSLDRISITMEYPGASPAGEGAIDVSSPVIFFVLTTMVAFWPILLGGGVMGKWLRSLPIVVILVLLGSLVESFMKMEHGYISIQRAQRQRLIKVTADVDETVANANEVRLFLENRVLPQPFEPFRNGGFGWRGG